MARGDSGDSHRPRLRFSVRPHTRGAGAGQGRLPPRGAEVAPPPFSAAHSSSSRGRPASHLGRKPSPGTSRGGSACTVVTRGFLCLQGLAHAPCSALAEVSAPRMTLLGVKVTERLGLGQERRGGVCRPAGEYFSWRPSSRGRRPRPRPSLRPAHSCRAVETSCRHPVLCRGAAAPRAPSGLRPTHRCPRPWVPVSTPRTSAGARAGCATAHASRTVTARRMAQWPLRQDRSWPKPEIKLNFSTLMIEYSGKSDM